MDNKNFWNKYAKHYSFFMRKAENSYKHLIKIIKPYLNKDMKALEIGCGTGQISFLLEDHLKELIATDFSEEMIAICNKNNTSSIQFQVEDATDLSFKESTFDIVIMANVLHIMPNPDKALNEIKRVLKPNGILFAPIFVNNKNKFNPKLLILEKLGFKTYMKTNSKGYINYIQNQNIEIIYTETIESSPLDECVVIGRVKE